ncbi:restriction endonuclease subunit S [Vibrio chagasii]|uniref:restriction endonuclease subunit S n=1 Tax=Vibrio chagasii TaxID=170679 RepID=UPI003D2F7A98
MSLDQTPINQLITDNIETWTSTVKTKATTGRGSSKKLELYGVKKLRELILELAVRGKLVPQDPSDEPASVLLERIAEEKAQLVKDKKIKKPKKLPTLSQEESESNLPTGWQWTHFINVLDFSGGGQPPKSFFSDEIKDGYVQLIQIRDLGPKPQPVYIPKEKASKFCTERDVMVGRYGASVGKVFWGKNGAYNVALIKIHNDFDAYIPEFIYLLLRSPLGQSFFGGISRSAQDGFSKKDIEHKLVPCLSLNEQHRIVAKVDELMTLCDQLEQQTEASITAHQVLVTTLLDTLTNSANAEELMQNWQMVAEHFDTLFTTEESIDQLKQTILQLAVMGKLVNIGEKKETLLKSVLTFGPRNGFSPKESSTETHLKVLKLGATSYGVLDLKQSKFIDVDISDKPHLYLNRGDILIQRGNSANFVGSNVLIQESYSDYIYPDLMMKLRVNNEVLPEYVSLLLSSKFSREHMWSQMTGTSGTMPKISKKVVEGVPIIFPVCLEVQKIILEKYYELIDVCELLMAGLNSLECTKVNLTDAIVEQAV